MPSGLAQQIVLQEYVQTVTEQTERLGRLELELHEQMQTWRFHPVVEALQALRGVQFTVAVTTVADLGDLTRCKPRASQGRASPKASRQRPGCALVRAASSRSGHGLAAGRDVQASGQEGRETPTPRHSPHDEADGAEESAPGQAVHTGRRTDGAGPEPAARLA